MDRVCRSMQGMLNVYRILVESQKEKDHWEDLDVDGRIILKEP
jgi:hypothetical protein